MPGAELQPHAQQKANLSDPPDDGVASAPESGEGEDAPRLRFGEAFRSPRHNAQGPILSFARRRRRAAWRDTIEIRG